MTAFIEYGYVINIISDAYAHRIMADIYAVTIASNLGEYIITNINIRRTRAHLYVTTVSGYYVMQFLLHICIGYLKIVFMYYEITLYIVS